MIRTGSDFSGVGAFDQALARLGIEQDKIFACDMDKYARQTYIHNYGEPKYYPENVYDREIPLEPLDVYMTSPPCQAFSLAGKRKGQQDERGILFYNSHEFIKKNKPRYFIFENVKGLLSDDSGRTFQVWLEYLGGKSVNGNPVIFPHNEAVNYHVYHKVLNAKHFGVPQNRERVFIIGIRDDADNDFNWPKPFPLVKRLKDVLEDEVDEKYFLNNTNLAYLERAKERDRERVFVTEGEDISTCITSNLHKGLHNGGETLIAAMRGRNPENASDRTTGAPTQQRLEVNKNGTSNTITSVQKDNLVLYDNPVVQFQLTGGKWDKTHEANGRIYNENGVGPTVQTMQGGNQHPKTFSNHKIRRLTPRECFRLMDFPDTFDFSVVSDTQAYKQAGNSIVVNVLAEIISKLKL